MHQFQVERVVCGWNVGRQYSHICICIYSLFICILNKYNIEKFHFNISTWFLFNVYIPLFKRQCGARAGIHHTVPLKTSGSMSPPWFHSASSASVVYPVVHQAHCKRHPPLYSLMVFNAHTSAARLLLIGQVIKGIWWGPRSLFLSSLCNGLVATPQATRMKLALNAWKFWCHLFQGQQLTSHILDAQKLWTSPIQCLPSKSTAIYTGHYI